MFKQLTNVKFPKARGGTQSASTRHLVWEQEREPMGISPLSPSPVSIRVCFGPHRENKTLWLLHHTFSSPGSTASCGHLLSCCQAQHCCEEHKTVWESLGFARWQKANRDCVTFVYSLVSFTLALNLPKEVFSCSRKHSTLPFKHVDI